MNTPTEKDPDRPSPGKILVIRLHAVGDVAIVLPYAASVTKIVLGAQVDFFTTEMCVPLVSAVETFTYVHSFPRCDTRSERLYHALRWAEMVRIQSYDLVVDVQNNWVT